MKRIVSYFLPSVHEINTLNLWCVDMIMDLGNPKNLVLDIFKENQVEYIAHLQVETCFIDIANWGTPPVFLNHCNMYYSQLNPTQSMGWNAACMCTRFLLMFRSAACGIRFTLCWWCTQLVGIPIAPCESGHAHRGIWYLSVVAHHCCRSARTFMSRWCAYGST